MALDPLDQLLSVKEAALANLIRGNCSSDDEAVDCLSAQPYEFGCLCEGQELLFHKPLSVPYSNILEYTVKGKKHGTLGSDHRGSEPDEGYLHSPGPRRSPAYPFPRTGLMDAGAEFYVDSAAVEELNLTGKWQGGPSARPTTATRRAAFSFSRPALTYTPSTQR